MASKRRDLVIGIAGDPSDFQRALGKVDKSTEQTEHRLKAFGGNVSHAFKMAGAAAAGVAVVGLKKAADAAIESEAAMAKVKTMVENTGHSWDQYGDVIDVAIQKQSRLTGMDDEELSESFANLLRTTKDVNEALKLNATASDLARAKGMTLSGAASLLARVYNGNYAGLKKLGIATDDLGSRQEALSRVQQQFAGQAEAYGKTTAGSIDKANVAWENILETVGMAVAPSIQKAADTLSRFVGQMEAGTGAGGEFADVAKDVAAVLGDVVGFLKEHPALVATAVGWWAAYKVAAMGAVAFTNLKSIRAAFAKGTPVAAEQGAIAGRAYAVSASAASSTAIVAAAGSKGAMGKAFALAGRSVGPLMAASLAYSFRKEIKSSAEDFADAVHDVVQDAFGKGVADALIGDDKIGHIPDYLKKKLPQPKKPKAGPISPSPGANAHPDNARASGVTASASNVIELLHDPVGLTSPNRDHGDHVHVAASSTAERDYLMRVATDSFGLTITSTTGGTHVAGSYHYRGLAFDAAGSRMGAFALWVKNVYMKGPAKSTAKAKARKKKKPLASIVVGTATPGGSGLPGGVYRPSPGQIGNGWTFEPNDPGTAGEDPGLQAAIDQLTAQLAHNADIERQRQEVDREKIRQAERNAAVIGANSNVVMAALAEIVNRQLGVNLGLGGSVLRSAPGKVASI